MDSELVTSLLFRLILDRRIICWLNDTLFWLSKTIGNHTPTSLFFKILRAKSKTLWLKLTESTHFKTLRQRWSWSMTISWSHCCPLWIQHHPRTSKHGLKRIPCCCRIMPIYWCIRTQHQGGNTINPLIFKKYKMMLQGWPMISPKR